MRPQLPRSRTLGVGAGALALVAAAGVTAATTTASAAAHASRLPAKQIEKVLQADGRMSHGVLEVDINRSDVHVVGGYNATPFQDGFQLQHEVFFQSLGKHKAIVNGDFSLKPNEIQPVIDSLLHHGLTLQAEHQHLFDLTPMMWFVHFRGVGAPVTLAKKVEAAIKRTSTPQPQSSPSHPSSPLPAKRLAHILGGDYTIGENGIVTVTVDRTDKVRLAGIKVKPDLGVSTNVQFQPTGSNGQAAVIPDFSMIAKEITPVMRTMRAKGWEVGCLYNQETNERPQLYFSHMFKTGNAVTLAEQIRKALNHTHV